MLSSMQHVFKEPRDVYIDPLHDADFYFILLRRLYRIVEEEAKINSRVANLKGQYRDLYPKIHIRDHVEHMPDNWEKIEPLPCSA
jgi:hypothetical protein